MNGLTNYRAAAPAIPTLSPKLRSAVALAVDPVRRYAGAGDEAPLVIAAGPIAPDAATIEEARSILPAAEAVAAPASREHIRKWLQTINAAVRNPQDADAFTMRLNAVLTLIGDAPASCWSSETLKIGLGRWQFFPSAAEVSALIEVEAAPIRRHVEALRKLSEATPDQPKAPPAPREAPTDAEKVAVADLVRDFKATTAGKRSAHMTPEVERPKPLPLPDAALLAEYERSMSDPCQPAPLRGLAEIRAKMLRERLGLQPTA